ncbi:unnamed protein product, partial [Sphenostylis stenocarpa]
KRRDSNNQQPSKRDQSLQVTVHGRDTETEQPTIEPIDRTVEVKGDFFFSFITLRDLVKD